MIRTIITLLTFLPMSALADAPAIEAVAASQSNSGWRFDVTLRHPDSGWDHYADGWEVLDADGNQLGMRVLAHPHETEQPFTRSLGGVVVPDGATSVFIRARCLVDGWNTESFEVTLP